MSDPKEPTDGAPAPAAAGQATVGQTKADRDKADQDKAQRRVALIDDLAPQPETPGVARPAVAAALPPAAAARLAAAEKAAADRAAAAAPPTEPETKIPPPLPADRRKRPPSLFAFDPERPRGYEEPTRPGVRWAGWSIALGFALGIAALLFASPANPWVGLLAFAALMLLTVIPARLIAAARPGRTIAGRIAVGAMGVFGVLAILLTGFAAWRGVSFTGDGIQLEPLIRVAGLLALAGLTLAPELRSVWAARVARVAAALFALWAAGEAALIGSDAILTVAGARDPASPLAPLAAIFAVVGEAMARFWPHAPLLAVAPALLAPRAGGGSFLLAGALYGALAWAALRFGPGASLSIEAQGLEGARHLLGAALLAFPAIPIAALAASRREVHAVWLWVAAVPLTLAALSANAWTLSAGPSALLGAPLAGAETLDFARGVGGLAMIALVAGLLVWLTGLAAFGRRSVR